MTFMMIATMVIPRIERIMMIMLRMERIKMIILMIEMFS